MIKAKFALVNGTLIPAEEASLNIKDLAIQRGYGVFDFFKTNHSKPIFLDDHLNRFFNSAEIMHLDLKTDRNVLKSQINKLIQANQIPESGIRLTLTGGYSSDGYNIAHPNLLITQTALEIARNFEKSIKLITYNYRRQLYSAKTLDYMTAIWLQKEIAAKGAEDVLYHFDNLIGECPRANVFIVTPDNTVLTARDYILKGVTRKHVLEVAGLEYETREQDITLQDLMEAREVFITSTTKNILAVSHIDGRIIGDGFTGKVTRELADRYSKLILNEAEDLSATEILGSDF